MSAIRRDKNRLNSAGSFSLRYALPYGFIKLARRYHMGELNPQVKFRLAFLDFNSLVRNVSLTCKMFKISKETLYKWQKRYNPYDLSSLEDQSKAPLNRRKPKLTLKEEEELKEFRKLYIKQGKLKLSQMYEKEKGKRISSW